MCGILAALGAPVDLRPGLAGMRHRGPDDGGWWAEDGVALGCTRLAIVDPPGGRQPLASEDGTVHGVVNGELYDTGQRADLERRGHRFATGSDSELALHLYEQYGLAFVDHLRGEFALILWDARAHRLVAVRDRFGIKPLCYAHHRGTLLLASEARALFALGVPAAWDAVSVAHATTHQYLPPDRTFFEGVRQLRPGHLLIAEGDDVRTVRYWDIDYGTPPDDPWSPQRVLALLDEAVRLRLLGDAPVACCLSGGLDSSAVAALATRHLPRPPTCFAVAFEETGYNEVAEARSVAEALGVPLHVVEVRNADLIEHLSDAVWFSEGLAINGQLVGRYLLSRAVHDAGYKCLLSGEGADETFFGYAHLQQDLYRITCDTEALAALLDRHPLQAGIMLPQLCEEQHPPAEPSFLATKKALGRRIRPLLRPDYPEAEDLRTAFDSEDQLAGRHPVEQSAYLWTRTALANYILRTLGDGAEMAHSVEGRQPFLDHHVFEYARSLPVTAKIHGPVEKHVLREALRGIVPETVRTRPKHPFLAPPLTKFASPALRDRVRDELRGDLPPFIDPGRLARWLETAWDDPSNDPVLYTLLSATALHRRFGLGSPC